MKTPLNSVERKALLFSLMIHLFVVQFFVVTFPVRPFRQEPVFFFLGSLLDTTDMHPRPDPRGDEARSLPAADVKLLSPANVSAYEPRISMDSAKPEFTVSSDRVKKKESRPAVAREKEGLQKDQIYRKLGIPAETPAYQPLTHSRFP